MKLQGSVSKLVNTFGSSWGRIRLTKEPRDIFFNRASLVDPAGFESLTEGQKVEFEEERDLSNGKRAVRLVALHDGAEPQADTPQPATLGA